MAKAKCKHPKRVRFNGPRVPAYYGSAPTEICAKCGRWRSTLHNTGPWQTAASFTKALTPQEDPV